MYRSAKKTAAKAPRVKLQPKGSVRAQFGEGTISPQVKLAATKRAKTQFGEGSISPQIKLVVSRLGVK